jgi:hypothetical protein
MLRPATPHVFLALGLLLLAPLSTGASELTQSVSTQSLSVTQLREDVRFVFTQIEQVHPHAYYQVGREEILKRQETLLDHLNTPKSIAEFYRDIAAFVDGYGDDHTEVTAPGGISPLKPPVHHSHLWKFHVLPDKVGYLDFAFMDDRSRSEWQTFLEQTFTRIKNERLAGLIIDLRTNTGGDSRLGDDLLAYLADKPYRSVTRKDWRFSAVYVAQLNSVDPWGLALGNADEEPPADFKALFAQHPPKALRAALRERAPSQARRILERHAPHWLDAGQTDIGETETLTLKFTALTTPPAEMPLRFRGPVVFLIGPETFSSAVILANTVEDFHLAPLIGEETKPCNQFGEPCFLELPNSRLRLAIATAQYVRANGDASDRHGVRPSILVSPSEPDANPSRDSVVLRAQEFIHNWPGSSK